MLKPSIVAVCLAGTLLLAYDLPHAEKIRGHSTQKRSHRAGGGSYYGHHYYPRYGAHYYGGYYGYYPFGVYYGYHVAPPVVVYNDSYGPDAAYVDTDVSPEEALVFLDGDLIGEADDFDGFPDYLTVSPGRHVLTFKHEGRRTVIRRVNLQRGRMLKLEFKLPRGTDDLSELVVDDPDYVEPEPGGAEIDTSEPESDDVLLLDSTRAGALRVSVSPEDASVYIDGKFQGTGQSLSRLHGDLRLQEGSHTIEVVRPGFESTRRTVDMRSGDRVTLEIRLTRKSDRRGGSD